MVRAAHAQVGPELDDSLAVARELAKALARVAAALERVPRDRVQRVAPGAVGEAAPPPDPASAAEALRHHLPLRDASSRDLDSDDLPDHLAVAVRAGPEVDRAVHDRQRAPDELAPEVRVRRHRPARPLGARREVERVDPPKGVSGIDRMCGQVDGRRPGDAVAVDLLADALELTEVGPPAHIA